MVGLKRGIALIAVSAAAFAVVVVLIPPSRGRTVVALLLPLLTLITVLTWWLKDASLGRATKLCGAGMALVAALFLGLGTTYPATIVAILWGIPVCMGGAFLVFTLWRGRAGRNAAVGLAFLILLSPWPLVRSSGASGQMMPDLFWVWNSPATDLSSDTEEPLAADLVVPRVASAADWPGFRGAHRDGVVAHAAGLHLDWQARSPAECWRRPVGRGWSSFAVVGELACTQDQVGESERTICLEAQTGRTVWVHSEDTRFNETAGGPGPRSTPLIHDGKVYSLGASGGLNCLDAKTGTRLWSADLTAGSGTTPPWGFAGSLAVHDELVFASPAGVGGVRLAAFDRHSGRQVWRAEGEYSGYSSAQVVELDGVTQVLLLDGGGLVAFSPLTGEELWQYEWPTKLLRAAQPHVDSDGYVIIGMGYGRGTRSLRITRTQTAWSVEERWATSRFKPKFNDFVVRDGYLFGLDEGILVALDTATGERLWKGGRYGYGQLLLVGETLLILTEKGDIVLVEASPTAHHELVRLPALTGKSWNHPAIARGRLFVRNGSEAVCFDLRPDSR